MPALRSIQPPTMELHVGIPAKLRDVPAAARQCSSHILAIRVTVRGSDVDLIAKENVSHASRNESDLQLPRLQQGRGVGRERGGSGAVVQISQLVHGVKKQSERNVHGTGDQYHCHRRNEGHNQELFQHANKASWLGQGMSASRSHSAKGPVAGRGCGGESG